MSRVFLIAQPTIAKSGHLPDLTPLADYGEVTLVTEVGENPSFKPGEVFQRAVDRLKDFDAENDYLVWAGGDTLSAVMAGAILMQHGHRFFRWLRFERGRRKGVAEQGKQRVERDDNRGWYTPVEVML